MAQGITLLKKICCVWFRAKNLIPVARSTSIKMGKVIYKNPKK
jgi:hypothetical protein